MERAPPDFTSTRSGVGSTAISPRPLAEPKSSVATPSNYRASLSFIMESHDAGPSSASTTAAPEETDNVGPSRPTPPPAGAGSEPPKPRASRACSSCNRQKLRCDGNRPCERCVSLHHEDTCEYLPSLRGKTRRKKGDVDSEASTPRRGHPKKRRSPDSQGRNKRSRWDVDEDKPLTEREERLEDNRDYQTWKRDRELEIHDGQRNSMLWKSAHKQSPGGPQGPPSPKAAPDMDKLTTLPFPGDAHNPLAVLAEASANAHQDQNALSPLNAPSTGRKGEKDEAGYYAPLERLLKDEAPHIMSLLNVHEAEQLFNMYFKYLHPYAPFLDKEHSSPSAVAQRSNFLFNSICCVAARAFNVVLWERLKDFARFEMERLPKEKNIEVVQGHLIYAEWNLIRPKHFEQDMSWLRVGVAVRTAIDINIHRVALLRQAREGLPQWLVRSIIRTWLLSYIIDRTLSAQLGKPSSMRGENSVRTYVEVLTEGNGRPTADDIWVAALAEWTQIVARAMDVFRSTAEDASDLSGIRNTFPDLVHVFNKQFRQWREKSELAARSCSSEKSTKFMIGNIRLYEHYARLVVQSFGLQQALSSPTDLPAAFSEYRTACVRLITSFEQDLESTGLIRGSPDFVFTVLTYAAVSLLRALQVQFAHLEPDREGILATARKAADTLARCAMTSDHLPASQSVFLSRLIDVKSNERPTPSATLPELLPEPIDFEAFAQAIDNDQSKTLWPPMPSPSTLQEWTADLAGGGTADPSSTAPQSGGGTWNISTGGTANGGSSQDVASAPATDLSTWVAQNSSIGVPLPGAALGLGMGSFQNDTDWMFNQESFWKSLLEGSSHPPGMV